MTPRDTRIVPPGPRPLPGPVEPQSPLAELMPDALPDLAVPAPPPLPPVAPVSGGPETALPLVGALKRWVKVLSAFLTAQVLTQILGLSAGLVLVRTMPVREFALYTLALSVVTFFTFASDLGSTTSLLYFFQRSVREGEDFRLYLAAVRSLRRLAFLVGAAGIVVALPRAAAAKGYGRGEIALATAGVLLSVWFQIRASLAVLALRLVDRYRESYVAEIAGAGVRLASAALLVWTAHLFSWLAVFGNALSIGAVAALARAPATQPLAPRAGGAAGSPAAPVPEDRRATLAPYRRRVLRYLLPTLPSSLYFSIQGPMVVWLAATFGSARNIAEVGALSRLGLLLSLFSNLSGVVLLPRLARIVDERLYRIRCLQGGALLSLIALTLWFAVLAFPHALLALLGQHYSGLDSELRLVVCGAGVTLVGGYVVGVNLARSWTRWQGLAVAGLAVTQVVLVRALTLGTTRGVLTFNVLSGVAGLALQAAITLVGFIRPSAVHWE
jgi:O-antigen/teichoic acid export membrane protein